MTMSKITLGAILVGQSVAQFDLPDGKCATIVDCPAEPPATCMGVRFTSCGACDLKWCAAGDTTHPSDSCHLEGKTCVPKKATTTTTTKTKKTVCDAPNGVSIPGLKTTSIPSSVKIPLTLVPCDAPGCEGGVKIHCTVPQDYTVEGTCECKQTCEQTCEAKGKETGGHYCAESYLKSNTIVAQCATKYFQDYCPVSCCKRTPRSSGGCGPEPTPAPVAPIPTSPVPAPLITTKQVCGCQEIIAAVTKADKNNTPKHEQCCPSGGLPYLKSCPVTCIGSLTTAVPGYVFCGSGEPQVTKARCQAPNPPKAQPVITWAPYIPPRPVAAPVPAPFNLGGLISGLGQAAQVATPLLGGLLGGRRPSSRPSFGGQRSRRPRPSFPSIFGRQPSFPSFFGGRGKNCMRGRCSSAANCPRGDMCTGGCCC